MLHNKADLLITKIESIGDLEVAADQLKDVISAAYQESCTIQKRTTRRKVPWWNDELNGLRQNARCLFNKAKKNNSWDEYKIALTEYNKAIRKSKRDSWRKYCTGIEETPQATRMHKALAKTYTEPRRHTTSFSSRAFSRLFSC